MKSADIHFVLRAVGREWREAAMRGETCRILLIGDRGVGKTSLIVSLMREKFEADCGPLTSDVTVPPDVTPEKVTTIIS